jgi:RNA-directed DNA polymerase
VRGGGVDIHSFDSIISVQNLLLAWQEFIKDKKKKKDVMEFQLKLMDNIFNLHQDLKSKSYAHGRYDAFKINDPKPRDIHKASVRDRLLHHAIYKILYPFFDKKFIYDSYSCRVEKGTHKAMERFTEFHRKVSKNNTKTCWVLKCDIRKFFASIDHNILKNILVKYVQDIDTLSLLGNIIDSFKTKTPETHFTNSTLSRNFGKGLPLGNLTSQLLVNIYMNEFDQFVKHKLKVKYYIRYADDFVFLSEDKKYLQNIKEEVAIFLKEKLRLELHPNKVYIKTLSSGVDFLGWVHFPYHRVLRTATKKRMFRNLKKNEHKKESLNSYLGMLKHGNAYKLKKQLFP